LPVERQIITGSREKLRWFDWRGYYAGGLLVIADDA
jgi:hypothetical protein